MNHAERYARSCRDERLAVFGDYLDESLDAGVELRQLLRWDPVLEGGLTPGLMHRISVEKVLTNLEARHVANATGLHVPVTSDLRGQAIVQRVPGGGVRS